MNEAKFVPSVNAQLAPSWFTVKLIPAIRTTPERASAVAFDSTRYVTLPELVLLNGDWRTIHAFVFSTVHGQPSSVVTATVFVAGLGVCVKLFVARLKVQPAAACETAKSNPAIRNTAERSSAVGFASTLKITVPLFVLLSGDCTTIHGGRFDTVHGQPINVSTCTVFVSAAAPTDTPNESKSYEHAAPVCVMVKSSPAMRTTPLR